MIDQKIIDKALEWGINTHNKAKLTKCTRCGRNGLILIKSTGKELCRYCNSEEISI